MDLSISVMLNAAAAINKDSSAVEELRLTTLSYVTMTVTCLSVVLEFFILQPTTVADAVRDTAMIKVEYSKMNKEILIPCTLHFRGKFCRN
jgi:hypothetical protein